MCWRVFSVKMVGDLLKHLKLNSVGKKSDKISLPNLDEPLLWVFIRGLFDSDGFIASPLAKSTTPAANMCSISKVIRQEISELCEQNSIKHYISDSYPTITFSGQNCLSFLNKIYNEANFFLQRKMNFYKIWKTWIPNMGTSIRPRKKRDYYPPLSEEHKEKIRESNRKRKGIKYVKS